MLRGKFEVTVDGRKGRVEFGKDMGEWSIVSFDDGGMAFVWNKKIKVESGLVSNLLS